MAHRQSDFGGLEGAAGSITIDRKIPLWGIITVCGAILGQGVLLWKGQELQAAQLAVQAERIKDLTVEVKALGAALATKEGKDITQDLQIESLSRRVTALEAMPMRGGR